MSEASRRFSTVVLPHLADARGLARWLTRDAAEAEDVVQEACLRALRSIDGYAGGNPRAWLLAIVRNVAFDRLAERRGRDRMLPVEDADEAGALIAPETPESLLSHATAVERLREATAGLPPLLREAFVLREVHRLAYREIAAATGVPVGTVMSRLSRARARLLAALAGDLDG